MSEAVPPRHLSTLLLLGMLTIPAIFCWFLLRRGYPASLRRTAFVFTAVMTVVPMIGRASP